MKRHAIRIALVTIAFAAAAAIAIGDIAHRATASRLREEILAELQPVFDVHSLPGDEIGGAGVSHRAEDRDRHEGHRPLLMDEPLRCPKLDLDPVSRCSSKLCLVSPRGTGLGDSFRDLTLNFVQSRFAKLVPEPVASTPPCGV